MSEEDNKLREAKQLIRSLLLTEKNGLILTALEKEHVNLVGTPIPCKEFGFQDSRTFLQSISDAVQVEPLSDGINVLCKAIPDRSVTHISDLVSKQKDGKCGYNRETKDILFQNKKLAITGNKKLRNKKQVLNSSPKSIKENSPFSEVQSISKMSFKPENMGFSTATDNSMSDNSESPFPKESSKIQSFTQKDYSQNISTKSISPQKSSCITEPQPFNNLFSSNISSISKNLPTIPQFTEPPPTIKSNNTYLNNGACNSARLNYQVPPPSLPPPTLLNRNSEPLYSPPPVDRLVGEFPDMPLDIYLKCLEILKENPMGLNIDDFKIAFEQNNDNVPLNYTRYGYKNMKDCLSTMINCLRINVNSSNDFVVIPSPQFCQEWASQIKAKQKAIDKMKKKSCLATIDEDQTRQNAGGSNFNKSAFTSSDIRKYEAVDTPSVVPKMGGINAFDRERFLEDYELLGDYVPVQRIEEHENEIEVMISDVVTPYRFYVQLKRRQADLANIFESMQNFYTKIANPKIPDEYIILNQICAAIFPDDQKWYRGRIIKIHDYMVEIFFIDYGNKATIPIDNIRLLHKKFSLLEAQAIQARHTGIIPKDQSFWDKQAIEKFKELLGKCHETGMIAIKKGIRSTPSGDIQCLVLIDTATNNFENGIQIHQEMLRLGLAEWKAANDSGYTTSSPANEKLTSSQNPNYAISAKVQSSNGPSNIYKPTKLEPEPNTYARPISVVAPTNNLTKKDPRERIRDHQQITSLIAPKSSEMKASSTIPAFNQHQHGISTQTISNQLQKFDTPEPTSVSVSKWLQTLPNDIKSISPESATNLNSPKQTSSLQNIMYDDNKPIIKEIVLANHELHIFNLYKKPYVISAEVSSLFPKWKKKDHLGKMIKLKKQNIPCLEISRASGNHESFFEQCLIEDVGGIETSEGDLTDSVTLYPMESIGSMLSLFGASGGLSPDDISRLSKAIERERNSFNPNDKFWSSAF